jgi:hypothetical protein
MALLILSSTPAGAGLVSPNLSQLANSLTQLIQDFLPAEHMMLGLMDFGHCDYSVNFEGGGLLVAIFRTTDLH